MQNRQDLRSNRRLQMADCGLRLTHFIVSGSQLPRRPIAHKSLHKSSMHRMPSSLRHHPALNPPPRQRQIPNQIQHLMPYKLILKTKWPIFNTLRPNNDRALRRSATDKPHIPQHRLILLKTKSPRRSNQTHIIPGGQVHAKSFITNGLREVDRVLNPIPGPRIDPDKFRPIPNLNFLQNLQILSFAPLSLQSNPFKCLNIWQGAPIQNGDLEVVHLDNHIVHAIPNQRRQKMLCR